MQKRNYGGLLLVVFLAFIGVRGLFWVCRDTALIFDSRNWVTSDAVIDRAWLDKTWSRGTPNYSLQVEYHFSVGGVNYQGNRFEIPSRRSSGDENYFRQRLAPYSPGTTVKILYDPKDPTRSVVTRPEMNYGFTFGLGSLSLLFSLGSIFLLFKLFRQKPVSDEPREFGIHWYLMGRNMRIQKHGTVELSEALKIVDDYLTRGNQKFQNAEDAIAATMFGFRRSDTNFIEICVNNPTQISCKIETSDSSSNDELHSREELIKKIEEFFSTATQNLNQQDMPENLQIIRHTSWLFAALIIFAGLVLHPKRDERHWTEAIFCIFVGVFMLFRALDILATHRIPNRRGSDITREKNPANYWTTIAIVFIVAFGLLITAAFFGSK